MENPIITSIKRSEFDEFDHTIDSAGSADEDDNDFTDADAAIDRMLDELQDFTFELEGDTSGSAPKTTTTTTTTFEPLKAGSRSPKSPKSPIIPTVTSSLDHLRFSTIAIEDTPDVDLDALLEDLCSMERDIMSFDKSGANDSGISSNSSTTLSSTGTTYSDSLSFSSHGSTKPMSPMSPRSPRSPVPANVTSDVRDRLENLQEETRELTPEEQEARIKAEKIKIALEKMKAASVQKLVVKVFDDNLETSKTMLMDQTWTAREVVSKMIKKNDVEVDPNWCLVEKLPEMHLERIMEENENVLPIVFDWTRDTANMMVFSKRRDKYTLFRNPQNFLLASGTSAGAAQLAEASKDVLLEEFFTKEHTRIPEVEGVLWLREGKKTWQKHYFVLRASGVYYTPKGKTKASRDLICLVKFEHASVYFGVGMKKKYKAPTDNVFCLKHPKVQTSKSKHVYYLCCEDQKTMHHWVISIRMAKYGYEMYDNYLLTQQNVEKELMLSSLANRGTASVKFQEDEEEFQEKPGGFKRRASASQREGTQGKTSSLSRVKGQGTSNLGSLFSKAWSKGVEETDEALSPPTPSFGAESILSPEVPSATFSVTNRASSISSKSSSKSSSSRGSLKSSASIDDQSKALQLEPVPNGRNSRASMNGSTSSISITPAAPPPPSLPTSVAPPAPSRDVIAPPPPARPAVSPLISAPPASPPTTAAVSSQPPPPPPPPPPPVPSSKPSLPATAPTPPPTPPRSADRTPSPAFPSPPPPPVLSPAHESSAPPPPPPPPPPPSERLPPPPPARSAERSPSPAFPSPPPTMSLEPPVEDNDRSPSPAFDFPAPPPPLPPSRTSSISIRSSTSSN